MSTKLYIRQKQEAQFKDEMNGKSTIHAKCPARSAPPDREKTKSVQTVVKKPLTFTQRGSPYFRAMRV